MLTYDYFKAVPFSVTICDRDGIVVYMNDASKQEYADDGGGALIGKSLVNCHPEPARSKLVALLENPVENSYIFRNGPRPLFIYDVPWIEEGIALGIIELLIPLEVISKHAAF